MNEFRKRAPLLAAALLAAAAGCAAPETRPRTSQTFPPSAPPKAPVERPAPPKAPPEAAPAPPVKAVDIAGHFRRGDYRKVVEEFDILLQRYPSHLKGADDLYYLGMSHYYLEEDDYALKSFLEFQYRFPGDPRAGKMLLVTAKVFRRMDRLDRALDTLRQAVHLSRDPEVRRLAREEKADILAGEGKYLQGLTVLDEAYGEAGPADRAHLIIRIEQLLDLMPVETIAQSVIAGDYHFPADLAEEVYTRRRIVPVPVEEPPPEKRAVPWQEMPLGRRADPMPPPEEDVRPVRKVGLLVPASGRLEPFGARVRRGVALALETHGAPPFPYRVEVVEIDEEEDLEGLAPLLSDENLEVLIGPLTSSTVERIVLAAEENGLAVFSPTASSSRLAGISPNFFRNCLTLEEYGAGLARFGVEVLGVRTFVVLVPDDSYGHRYAEIFGGELEKLGGSVLAVESYDDELTDYAKPIGTLKKAIGMPDPLPEPVKGREAEFEPYVMPFDGIFLPGSAEEVGLIVPQLSFHDIDVRQLAVLGVNGLNTPVFPERGEDFAEGAFFIDSFFAGGPDPAVQSFVTRYREVYGEEPGTFVAQAYDAATLIIGLMGQGVAGRGAMLAALGSVADFPGVTGPTTLYPGGYVVRPPRFGTVFKRHLISVGRWESGELP